MAGTGGAHRLCFPSGNSDRGKVSFFVDKREWIKTAVAAALTLILILFLGNRRALYDWLEAGIYTGILMGSFYGGVPWGMAAGAVGGLLRWYVIGGELLQVAALTLGSVFAALFRRLGKAGSCLAFLFGTVSLHLLLGREVPFETFGTLLISMVVFLVVSPGQTGTGAWTRADRETAAAGSPALFWKTDWEAERNLRRKNPAAASMDRSWKRLGDNLVTLSGCFEDQEVLIPEAAQENLTAGEWKQRFLESRQALRLQFQQIGQAIGAKARDFASRRDVTAAYLGQVRGSMRRHQLILKQLQILEDSRGRQEIFVRMQSRKRPGISALRAAALFHTEKGKRFIPAYDCPSTIGARVCDLHLIERPAFQVLCGTASRKKEESGSGDCFSTRILGEQKILLCLSDGMGTGKKAGLESRMTVELLEQLLENGFTLMAAVSMINDILLNGRSQQSPTTLDICLFDLYSGECQFAKLGAAAGYLKRGKGVSAIRGQAVPLGIISWENTGQNLVPREILQSGDILVMMTDGAFEKAGIGADEILKELISECPLQNAQEMASWLLERLLELDERIEDDMMILVAGIWKR